MQEGTYEFENNSGHFSGEPWDTRRGRFWSVLAGGTAGDGFGSQGRLAVGGHPGLAATPGAELLERTPSTCSPRMPWWELRPSGTDPGFAGRRARHGRRWHVGRLDYITSALTRRHDWLLAYVPVTGSGASGPSPSTCRALAGPVRARWFDPATGNYLAISDGHEYDEHGHAGVHDARAVAATARTTGCWSSTRRRTGAARSRGRRVHGASHDPGRGDVRGHGGGRGRPVRRRERGDPLLEWVIVPIPGADRRRAPRTRAMGTVEPRSLALHEPEIDIFSCSDSSPFQDCSSSLSRSPKQTAGRVDPPIQVETATWSRAGQIHYWVKERLDWFGRVRGADGRQRWIRAADLRPASGSLP